MVTLHHISGSSKGIVVGTEKKLRFWGWFTQSMEMEVLIYPHTDLMKSEVWELGKKLNILQSIIDAPPTDGLWEDGRIDKDQLGGLTYEQLEEAMLDSSSKFYTQYNKIRMPNLYKMKPIPIFKKMKTKNLIITSF